MITVKSNINAPIETVWECWTNPKHITQWNNASDDWHTPYAENDLQVGGKFKYTMASKDGTMSFDFEGEYTLVEQYEAIEYVMADGRRVVISFAATPSEVAVIESFDPETENSEELQQQGWQAILNNFKKYVESL
ncbi:polyketide cyclase [Flavobacterium sp. ZT3R18]|uniref:SRPBCC family protein n=1 Tax=Flavobacterium sp. ZT3R18 TaxID=2594429 RepID=UPI001179BF44|nr:SRPBCC family protein [Flavobacterium sp. ZT3R18]TRX38690.1 polyketide cyclase [Flavobacterium sp. ZT3R18]